MDLPALIIGIAIIVAFVLSLAQRPEPPVPQLVIMPPSAYDASWAFLMIWGSHSP